MTTRWSVKMCSSPGKGYFHACSSGCPTRVLTRYISPTLRPSCWKVAIRFESGDHSRMGRSLLVQPALLVAYAKSFTPSVVTWTSFFVATSRTQRLKSRTNAARLPSGERMSLPPCPPPAPPPRPPPQPPCAALALHGGRSQRTLVP